MSRNLFLLGGVGLGLGLLAHLMNQDAPAPPVAREVERPDLEEAPVTPVASADDEQALAMQNKFQPVRLIASGPAATLA